ncbi:MAG: glycosyltransferase family 2 protein [Bacteroidales bacterium]|jgi:glycosyltransferase involved in cell wall biosynthesis|nr:glycosyltransferase family 2 protein [Bacteroidales bacterium]
MKKVSVIIPVYNIEKYIGRCVESLFNQTLSDMEFIFVNDCTSDRSMEILQSIIDKYPQHRDNIKILQHENNMGLAATRTSGVMAASGEYIIHCDSDDWLEPNACSEMYITAKESNADIVWCDFYLYHNGENQYVNEKVENNNVAVLKAMLSTRIWWSLCTKIYNREFYLSHLDANSVHRNGGEDMLNMKLFYWAKNVKHIPHAYYHYDISNQFSMTNRLDKKKIQSYIDAVRDVEEFFKEKPDYDIYAVEINHLKAWLKYLFLYGFTTRKDLRRWCDLFRECNPYMYRQPNTSTVQRFIACMTLWHLFIIVIWRNKYVAYVHRRKNTVRHDDKEVPQRFGEVPESLGEVPERFGEVPESFGEVPESLGEVPERFGEVPENLGEVNFPKISVIIPVYNVEKYIGRCVESLFNQTLDDIEYIFVNDATPDGSMDILQSIIERYPQRKAFVKIFNNASNRKLYQTRQVGLAAATGVYVMHVDSDDWLELDACEKMYAKAKETNADIVWCDFYNNNTDGNFITKQREPEIPFEIIHLMLATRMRWNVWAKLVRRSLYDNSDMAMNADCTNFGEDMVTIKLFYYAKRVVYVPEALYHYDISGENSITKQILPLNKIYECLNSVINIDNFFSKKAEHKLFEEDIMIMKLSFKSRFLVSNTNRHIIRELSALFPETNDYILSVKNYSSKLKLINFLAKYHGTYAIIIINFVIRTFRKLKHS